MFEDETREFIAVVNQEDQYSIWPTDLEPPEGWLPAGSPGPKAQVLAFIEEVWTDMRPRSLRERMDA